MKQLSRHGLVARARPYFSDEYGSAVQLKLGGHVFALSPAEARALAAELAAAIDEIADTEKQPENEG